MISCRFVGDSSMLGDREYDVVGQKAMLSEQGYREAVLGGAAFIPEEEFKGINFTPDELSRHGASGMRIDPPSEFLHKLSQAQQLFRDIREKMSHDKYAQQALSDTGESSS